MPFKRKNKALSHDAGKDYSVAKLQILADTD